MLNFAGEIWRLGTSYPKGFSQSTAGDWKSGALHSLSNLKDNGNQSGLTDAPVVSDGPGFPSIAAASFARIRANIQSNQ